MVAAWAGERRRADRDVAVAQVAPLTMPKKIPELAASGLLLGLLAGRPCSGGKNGYLASVRRPPAPPSTRGSSTSFARTSHARLESTPCSGVSGRVQWAQLMRA